MKPSEISGVFREKNRLFTVNPEYSKNIKIYNEQLLNKKGIQYRSWNPYRSKLAAGILKDLIINIKPDSNVLYLGAATGTTVSHISDIVKNGMVYSVENSPFALQKLIKVCEIRKNIIPLFHDANQPDNYVTSVPKVDLIYQDISQRNQAEIFISNIKKYLKKDGTGVLMVKARSIDVSLKPEEAYKIVSKKLEENGYSITDKKDLKPFEKDHAVLIVTNK